MDNSDNPALREHYINTEWQKLLDLAHFDFDDFEKETDLALEILENAKLPFAFEILRIGTLRIADRLWRNSEEKEASDG